MGVACQGVCAVGVTCQGMLCRGCDVSGHVCHVRACVPWDLRTEDVLW